MPRLITIRLAVIMVMLAAVSACSTDTLKAFTYDTLQSYTREECIQNSPASARYECMGKHSQSYEEDQRSRNEFGD